MNKKDEENFKKINESAKRISEIYLQKGIEIVKKMNEDLNNSIK